MSVPAPTTTPTAPAAPTAAAAEPKKRVNLRTPDVMAAVQAQVETHYRSELVEKIRARGGVISAGGLTVRLAKQFGFCYGVERAIDLAYAARQASSPTSASSSSARSSTTPRSTSRSARWASRTSSARGARRRSTNCRPTTWCIVPAFGAEVATIEHIKEQGLPDRGHDLRRRDERLEAGAPIRRRRRDQHHPRQGRARGNEGHRQPRARQNGRGHYLVVLTLDETDYVCDYIRHGGDRAEFLEKFDGAYSPGFDPDLHLKTRRCRQPNDDAARRNRGSAAPHPPGGH